MRAEPRKDIMGWVSYCTSLAAVDQEFYELGRVDVLWLFYFCTIKHEEQGIMIWKESTSFGCFISLVS